MEDIEELLGIAPTRKDKEKKKSSSSKKASKSSKRRRKDDSESEEDYSPSDRSDQSDYDDYDERGLFAEVKKYGSDLTMGEDDKKWLDSLPELKREEILAERSENRQKYEEELALREKLKLHDESGRRSKRSKNKDKKAESLDKLRSAREKKRRKGEDEEGSRKKRRSKRSDDEDSEDEREREERRRRDDEARRKREEEEEREFMKNAPGLDTMQQLVVKRKDLQNWVFAPFFQDTVCGLYVRTSVKNNRTGKVEYQIFMIEDVVEAKRPYRLEDGNMTDKDLRLSYGEGGKTSRSVSISFISSSPATQSEYEAFLYNCRSERIRLPSTQQLERKRKELKKAVEHIYTDIEINAIINAKMQVKKKIQEKTGKEELPHNIGQEKARLAIEYDVSQDPKAKEAIKKRMEYLDSVTVGLKSGGTLAILETVNRRNRLVNTQEGGEAELEALRQRRAMGSDALDAFSRRKTRPRQHVAGTESPAPAPAPGPSASPAPASAPVNGQDRAGSQSPSKSPKLNGAANGLKPKPKPVIKSAGDAYEQAFAAVEMDLDIDLDDLQNELGL